MRSIELLARGVLIHNGCVLLAHVKGATNTFLPGGHIAFGESAEAALVREIREEIGRPVRVQQFLGAIEHGYGPEANPQCELNLVFAVECASLSSTRAPESQEGHLEFLWQPLNDLARVNLQPYPLWDLLPQWLEEGAKVGWGSTLKKAASPIP